MRPVFRTGDQIKSVDGKPVDDPTRLPDEMCKLAGKEIAVEVSRADDAGHDKPLPCMLLPACPSFTIGLLRRALMAAMRSESRIRC